MEKKKITPAMRAVLRAIASGERAPVGHGANAASAWRRTVRALRRRALVRGDVRSPEVTEAGRRCLTAV